MRRWGGTGTFWNVSLTAWCYWEAGVAILRSWWRSRFSKQEELPGVAGFSVRIRQRPARSFCHVNGFRLTWWAPLLESQQRTRGRHLLWLPCLIKQQTLAMWPRCHMCSAMSLKMGWKCVAVVYVVVFPSMKMWQKTDEQKPQLRGSWSSCRVLAVLTKWSLSAMMERLLWHLVRMGCKWRKPLHRPS